MGREMPPSSLVSSFLGIPPRIQTGFKVTLDETSGTPGFILLEHPIRAKELSLGAVVLSPMTPLDAFSPSNQSELRDLVMQHGWASAVSQFDVNAVTERASGSNIRSWLENSRGKDRAVALSAAAVMRHSLDQHALAFATILQCYKSEIIELLARRSRAYVVVGLMEFTDGTIRRTDRTARAMGGSVSIDVNGSVSIGMGVHAVGGLGPSASLTREERSDFEAMYRGERIFAVQYRVLRYRRSGLFSYKKEFQLGAYMSKTGSKSSVPTFL